MLDSTEIYDGVKWNIVENARLPYGTVWSKIIKFDEKILLFGTVILYDAFLYYNTHTFLKEVLITMVPFPNKPFMTSYWSSILRQKPGSRSGS